MSMNQIAAEHAKQATYAKNCMLHARTDWERNQQEMKLQEFKSNLSFVIDFVDDVSKQGLLKEVLRYLNYKKDDQVCRDLMRRANDIIKRF